MCIRLLVEHVSIGGNMLMNVGLISRGMIDGRALIRLDACGKWMNFHARSIRGCGQAPAGLFIEPEDWRYTFNQKTKRLYPHLFSWQFKNITIPGLSGRIRYAQRLFDGSDLRGYDDGADFRLELPSRLNSDLPVPVIESFLKD